MKKLLKKLLLLLLIPFLYIRYSFIYCSLILFVDFITLDMAFGFWIIYAMFFGFLMGVCGLIKHTTRFIVWAFGIEYEVCGYWMKDAMHSASIWIHPNLKVGNKIHELSFAIHGSNIYDEEDQIRRAAILYSIF